MQVSVSDYGKTGDGVAVELYTLTNQAGNRVQLTNYGAILVSVEVPDQDGQRENVNLGFPSLDGYLQRHSYLGSTVGRFCNRIANGQFTLDGTTYSLVINNGPNHLHGGTIGFDKFVWSAETYEADGVCGVRFSVEIPDGHENYPGKLNVTADYSWNDHNELKYVFGATTDKPTVINMTNHAYWNLGGVGSGDILNTDLQLNCDHSLAVDESLIPTGEILDVAGSVLDFRSPHALGERIQSLEATKGYDHCYVVNGSFGELRVGGKARDPKSGRTMTVSTTQPGMQLYTGNHLGGEHQPYGGFCLETQHYPDSPNKPDFPTTRLNPDETFSETTIHKFGVE